MVLEKPKISIDIDNVLRDIIHPICKLYNSKYGTYYKKSDINVWDLAHTFKEMPANEVNDFFFRKNAKEVFEWAPTETRTTAHTLKFLNQYFDVRLVTHQYKGNEGYTVKWLRRNMLGYNSLHFTSDKGSVDSLVLLDDSVANLERAESKGIIPICYSQPWNTSWTKGRVSNLEEFYTAMKTLYGVGLK